MTVTRNVIYDLLPAYFAGEVSADTRTLVDEFLESDPELRRMADRFRERLQERTGIDLSDAGNDRERIVFQRAKARFKLRQATLAWAFGAAVGIGMAFLTGLRGPLGLLNPRDDYRSRLRRDGGVDLDGVDQAGCGALVSPFRRRRNEPARLSGHAGPLATMRYGWHGAGRRGGSRRPRARRQMPAYQE